MKKFMMFAIIAITGFVFMPNVHAAYNFDNSNFDSNIKQTGAGTKDDPYILKLQHDAAQDIEIKDGKYVVIDLNGKTLTNYTASNCSVISIENGNVTIKDSSSEGTGKIQLKSDASSNLPTIGNKGTLIIEGGTIIANNGHHSNGNSTGIYNGENASLTINGGVIETSVDTAWGITNLGTAEINDGTFNQKNKLSIIENSADMTINGGTFTSTPIAGQEAIITNDKGDLGEAGAATLKIKGGDFQVDKVINEIGDGTTTISGGTYQKPENVQDYIVEGLTFDENGKVVKMQEVLPQETTENKETNPDTADMNLLSLLALILTSGFGITYSVKKSKKEISL